MAADWFTAAVVDLPDKSQIFHSEIMPLPFCAVQGLQAVYKSRVAIWFALHSHWITPLTMARQGSELVVFTPRRLLQITNQ